MPHDIDAPPPPQRNEIVVYQPDETLRLETRYADESIWLPQLQIAKLFGVQKAAISKHLKTSTLRAKWSARQLFPKWKRFKRKEGHKTRRSRAEFVEYPERAVHEALVNAFIHRDYLVTGSEVHVDLFDDRLEITSPGGMPGERRIEEFDVRKIPSIRRNGLLADMCERLRIMERRGSGFKKIFEDYGSRSFNPARRTPGLESTPIYFRVTLPNLLFGLSDEQLAALAEGVPLPVVPPVVPPVAPPVPPPVRKPSEALLDSIQRRVIARLAEEVLSTSELALKVGISQPKDMRRRYLRLLLDMGLIEYTIPGKPNSRLQKYRLTAKGRAALA